jgi:bifunctional enzyme CysN/CysC/sulfate adenylyltransferase subunit 1
VKSIVTYDGELASAAYPQSVTLELDDEIDLSRGEMLVGEAETAPHVSTGLRATAVWMNEAPLEVGRSYLLKHTTRTVRATATAIRYRVDVNTAEHVDAAALAINDIGEVEFEANLPLFFDPYAESRGLGSFIVIDPLSNATLGAGMIVAPLAASPKTEEVPQTRLAGFVLLPGKRAEALALQQRLEASGSRAVIVDDPLIPESSLPAVARAFQLAGVTAISARLDVRETTIALLRQVAGDGFAENLSDAEESLGLPRSSENGAR